MSNPRLIAIGDIHGCVHALTTVLDAIGPRGDDCIVVLGDMIDCGRDTSAVIERLIALRDQCQLVVIMGNHEELLLEALGNPRLRDTWFNCGGVDTVFSYRYGGGIDDIPQEHLDFMRASAPYYETERHIFTHAAYDPDLPMSEQSPETLRWMLLDPMEARPHVSGKTVIVGHWAQRGGEILDLGFAKCIDTYACGYGWLTALDVHSGQVWQASRWGVLRGDESNRGLRKAAELMAPAATRQTSQGEG